MEISIRDAQKIVEVWLTNSEKNDPAVAARLQPLYRAYQKQKYTVAVFQSGNADLFGCCVTIESVSRSWKPCAKRVRARLRPNRKRSSNR